MNERMKKSYIKDLVFGVIIIIMIYILGLIIWQQFSELLLQIPIIYKIYNLTMLEVQRRSVIGLSIMTFLGSLFFVAYPAELLYLVYTRFGYSLIYVTLIMLFYTMLGQAVNYSLGYFIEEKFLRGFVRKRKKQYLGSLAQYDMLFIIILNIVPLPADILSLILGIIKYDFKKTMIYTFIGKILKFLFLGILVWLMNGFLF